MKFDVIYKNKQLFENYRNYVTDIHTLFVSDDAWILKLSNNIKIDTEFDFTFFLFFFEITFTDLIYFDLYVHVPRLEKKNILSLIKTLLGRI